MNIETPNHLAILMEKAMAAGTVTEETIMSLCDSGRRISREVSPAAIFAALSESLKERIRAFRGAALPRIILMLGPCRVGSTALAQVFGLSGIPSFYQPIKTMVRWRLIGKEADCWQDVIMEGQDTIAIKETIGPFTITESVMDPVKILLAGGYPAHLVNVVFLDREPEETLGSWYRIWDSYYERSILLRNYIIASRTFYRRRRECVESDELSLGFPLHFGGFPYFTVPRLFGALGLTERWRDHFLSDWGIEDFRDPGSKVRFLGEPGEFVEQEVLKTQNRYVRLHRSDLREIQREERDALMDHALYDEYLGFMSWSSKLLAVGHTV